LTFSNIGRGFGGETIDKIFFPYGKWVFIEITNSRDFFKISLYNNNGTMLDSKTLSGTFVLPSG